MLLQWKDNEIWGIRAVTPKGYYEIKDSHYLVFAPADGKVSDPDAEGVEYLGRFDDPKAAAEQHFSDGSLP